jgi:hypothetical protein
MSKQSDIPKPRPVQAGKGIWQVYLALAVLPYLPLALLILLFLSIPAAALILWLTW